SSHPARAAGAVDAASHSVRAGGEMGVPSQPAQTLGAVYAPSHSARAGGEMGVRGLPAPPLGSVPGATRSALSGGEGGRPWRALQFHGQETPEDLADYTLPVIKTIKLPPASTIEGLPEYRVRELSEVLRYQHVGAAILLDSAARWSEGETREPIEWHLARRVD